MISRLVKAQGQRFRVIYNKLRFIHHGTELLFTEIYKNSLEVDILQAPS